MYRKHLIPIHIFRTCKENDDVILREFIPELNEYTGREVRATITYILTDEFEGVAKGYCIFGMKYIECKNVKP